ncbi:MAG TPA: molybdenum cofactor biosynthesis protein MoaE [Anaerolineales bacterium]|nr:molybdenum cofactor biosynthesis protein MoaE [Anaerolineales bacterium]
MRITILYFASLRQRVGFKEEALEIGDGASIADVKTAILTAHPELGSHMPTVIASVNREFAADDHVVGDGDEVALFPPVSGGGEPPTVVEIAEGEIDFNRILARITLPTTGAACVFSGMVRGQTERAGGRQTDHLEYEAYPAMAEGKMRQVADEIRARWPQVEGIAIVQRVGRLAVGTPTVLIACSSAHRDSGVFDAARYGIDRLKEIVPVWKKETGPAGEEWVEGDYRPTPGDRTG